MKKITLFTCLLFSAFTNAQTTYAIYTEDPEIEAGLSHFRFINGQGLTASEATTAPYEGTKNYLFSYNGTNSYIHGIFMARNSDNTSDTSVNIADFSYYNLAVKTVSGTPFYIRMRGNTVTAKVLINPASNSYNFSNDGEWHFLSIPFTDFIPESGSFSLTNVTEIFVLRSDSPNSLVGSDNDFEIDNLYLSTEEVMSTSDYAREKFTVYPNPATNDLTISTSDSIDSIKIYSVLGQKVIEWNPPADNYHHARIDVSALKSGIYIVTAESKGTTTTTRFVKK